MKHDLRTLEEVLKVVTAENIDGFLTDFRGWLTLNMLVDTAQEVVGVENAEIYMKEKGVFHWIDDGKTEAHIHIEAGNFNSPNQ